MVVPLHPDVEALAYLLGTWAGRGHGEYPTIESFDYDETVTFSHIGKPFLVYVQRTTHAADGRPLHAETGYWRVPRAGRIELVIAHPNGIVEVSEGTIDGGLIRVQSTVVAGTSFREVRHRLGTRLHVRRQQRARRYDLRMAAVGVPLTHHLTAELRRTASG